MYNNFHIFSNQMKNKNTPPPPHRHKQPIKNTNKNEQLNQNQTKSSENQAQYIKYKTNQKVIQYRRSSPKRSSARGEIE